MATVTRDHISTLPCLKEELGREGISLSPYFCEIAYAKNHERRDPAYQRHAEETIAAMGGRVGYLLNVHARGAAQGPWGVGDLGAMDNWKAASASGAGVALNLARGHDAAVVYCHDSLYALASDLPYRTRGYPTTVALRGGPIVHVRAARQ